MTRPPDIAEDIWNAFRSDAMLRAASDEGIASLARGALLCDFAKGELIFHEGEQATQFGVVIAGHARAVHFGTEGHATTFITLWPGDSIGSRHGLGGNPFEFDVQAEDAVTMAILPLSSIKQLLLDEPAAALSVIEDLSSQLVQLISMTKTLRLEVPDRIAYYVSNLPREQISTNSYSVTLPTSRVEIAAVLGTSPETLSRAFQTLKKSGVLRAEGATVTVLDEQALLARIPGNGH